MVLLKYYNRIEPRNSGKINGVSPKSDGPLANVMPTSTMQAANKAVCDTFVNSSVWLRVIIVKGMIVKQNGEETTNINKYVN